MKAALILFLIYGKLLYFDILLYKKKYMYEKALGEKI